MIRSLKRAVWGSFVRIDAALKFPNLRPGETGIQVGFDMNAPVTTDLFLMHRRVNPGGVVVGIDADPSNVEKARRALGSNHHNVILLNKAIYAKKGRAELLLGESASWNQLNNIPIDTTVALTPATVEVQMDTLDNVVDALNLDIHNIGHINLTINGAEYFALKGMERILSEAENINITVVAGRYDESGTIDGRPDHEAILELLQGYGFRTSFKRIHQLFWWGFVVNTLMGHKWIYGKNNYGVIFASKGNKDIKWYQSFS